MDGMIAIALSLMAVATLAVALANGFGIFANWRLLHYLTNVIVNHHAQQMSSFLTPQSLSDRVRDNLVGSITTTPSRMMSAVTAIESVLLQSVRPHKICLYISDKISPDEIPAALRRLEPYGVEVRRVEDVGPHTKLLYALRDFPEHHIFTFDDDIYYPANAVETLLNTAAKVPHAIVANWVRKLRFGLSGKVRMSRKGKLMTPRSQLWQIERPPSTIHIGHDLFAYGTSGVLYPPHCMDERVFDIDLFRKLCPKDDDVWFKAMSLLKGTPVATSGLGLNHEHYCILGSQAVALRHANYGRGRIGGASATQIRAVFEHFDLYAKLAELKGRTPQ